MNQYESEPLHRRIFNAKLQRYLGEIAESTGGEYGDVTLSDVATLASWLPEIETWCKSPIEMLLGVGLCFGHWGYGIMQLDYFFGPDNPFPVSAEQLATMFEVRFTPQANLGIYTADFLIHCYANNQVRYFAVECDGHDFHDRTKEQASRDRRRDRRFLRSGIPTLRFTGSDLFNKLDECIEEIEMFSCDLIEEMWPDLRPAKPKKGVAG